MAKITKEDIAVAHKLILANDLEGICKWIDLYQVRIDKKIFRSVMQKVFVVGDTPKALKMFDAIKLEGTDPVLENLLYRFITRAGCIVGLAVGLSLVFVCLVGVMHLFSALFGW